MQNQKIQLVRKLLKQKKERDDLRSYVIEGIRLVEEAIPFHADCQFILYANPLSERAKNLIADYTFRGVTCEEISENLMNGISDTETPQGILAVMSMAQRESCAQPSFIIIADELHDPGNLGTLFRTATAAKADMLILSPGCVDPYAPKTVRSGMGSHFHLPFFQWDWEKISLFLNNHSDIKCYAANSQGGCPCWETDFRGKVALIIGSEAHGPCEKALSLARSSVLIPMPGKVESLNAAIAAGILIFEVVRQRYVNDHLG